MRPQQFLRWSYQILLFNFIFLALGFCWRWAFLLSYGHSYSLGQLVPAFILGLRFDQTVLCYVHALPLLFFFLATLILRWPRLQKASEKILAHAAFVLALYYSLFLLLINAINIVDLFYYGFYQDRINVLVFGFINDDTLALIKTMWKNYPILWLFGGLFAAAYGLFLAMRRVFRVPAQAPSEKALSWPLSLAVFFCLFFLNGVAARGSLGLFPLSEMDTNISEDAFINHLCFNGTRALARAVELKSLQKSHWDSDLKKYGYGENYRQAFADYFQVPLEQVPTDPLSLLRHQTPKNPWAAKTRPHVLLLVMESFGSYWLKFNSPSFNLTGDLQKHFAEDPPLTNFMSSTGATIGSLSSLMIGAPQRPVSEFLTESEYLQVPFRTAPARTYKAAGYRTRFVYGGSPGWREIDKFARFQAFDSVEGENEISKKLGGLNGKHDWGVFDEDVWNYLWESLQEAKEPQFILTMTTTNHPPYQLPSNYTKPDLQIPAALQKRLIGEPSLPAKRFATYRYSNQKLAEFLDRLKHSPLKDKVIVAVTGDHTFWIVNFDDDELLQKSAVPLYIYAPAPARKKWDPATFGSHPDIFPTLYNMSLSEATYDTTATDLYAPTPHFALDYSGLISGPPGAIMLSGNKTHYYGWQAGGFEKLVPDTANPSNEAMALHYKSLMGVLDYYMMSEKKLNITESPTHAHSGR